MGGVFGPPDTGFPATGVIAEGTLNTPGWTYAESTWAIARVRADGACSAAPTGRAGAGRDSRHAEPLALTKPLKKRR